MYFVKSTCGEECYGRTIGRLLGFCLGLLFALFEIFWTIGILERTNHNLTRVAEEVEQDSCGDRDL